MRGRGGRLVVVVLAVIGALFVGNDPSGGQAAPTEGGSLWRSVSPGRFHTCGIRTTGRLYCWGSNSHGQLGNGSANSGEGSPTEVAGGHTDWTQVSAGGEYTCGRRRNGRLYCWGRDDSGQLGNGNADFGANQPLPVAVAGNVTTWTAVSAGEKHTCARRSNGRLYCWGSDGNGRLGNGPASTNDQTVPNQVAGSLTTWTSVSAGGSHTCGRRSNGRLYCWGADEIYGQLGNGATLVDKASPTVVAGGFTNWSSVTAGVVHTCGRRSNGRLYCWGFDSFGELGNGTALTGARPTPTQVAGARTDWTAVDAGENHTCARRASGRLFCWGRAAFGALGNGTFMPDRPAPLQVAGNRADWTAPSAGMNHTCARTANRHLFCWGSDNSQQLGDGATFTNQPAPVAVDP